MRAKPGLNAFFLHARLSSGSVITPPILCDDMELDDQKKRYPLLACLLSLTGVPLGQLYGGYPRRAIFLFLVCITYVPVASLSINWFPLPQILTCFIWGLGIVSPILLSIDAYLVTRRNMLAQLANYQKWWVTFSAFLLASLLASLVSSGTRAFIAEAFAIPSPAMSPTIQLNDRIIVDKLLFDSSRLKRDDLVVYSNPGESIARINRVIGLPGETIEIKNDLVFIDGFQISDEHASNIGLGFSDYSSFGPMVIPEGSYFVLGDNRYFFQDSRKDGPIFFENVIGVARVIFWSSEYETRRKFGTEPKRIGTRWDRIGKRLD